MGLAEDVEAAVAGAVAAGEVPGAAWWVARGREVARGAAGTHTPGADDPVRPDTVFRIASTTKPVVAAAALSLVDDGTLALDEPVDAHLPELADRVVLADPADALAGTVPARRAITVRDVLTFRLGLGLDFAVPWPSHRRAGRPLGRLVRLGRRPGQLLVDRSGDRDQRGPAHQPDVVLTPAAGGVPRLPRGRLRTSAGRPTASTVTRAARILRRRPRTARAR
ncbi:Beta-lactamase [Geodermatophilus siccatus]|uniref:Beta-lactamase n=1 Tax=Geodermatophilus siccatus TaxID=1137991 RepID=A0A1G9PHR4_9ACTN|nr:serine hydrolase domain-containing protein [Geodermatophilus siccatus]SDL98264.1 Beta-lactamase [Geodermatophilus siccatus]